MKCSAFKQDQRSGKEKKKEPLVILHIVQDEPNELYGQLASISNRPTTCIAANFSSKAIKVLWLILMLMIMICPNARDGQKINNRIDPRV